MPPEIQATDSGQCGIADCVAALQESGFDPADPASLDHAAIWLRRLGNNRDFLPELMLGELKARHRADEEVASYGPQVLMLSPARGEFFLRANIWPSPDEPAYRASSSACFVYGLPHDHNFDFLSVGYFGPGYWSDYWEADYPALAGWQGEPAQLRFTGRARLGEGKLVHYRAHRDVHRQLPPDALSVSLNVMHANGAQAWLDQYRFDVEREEVAGILNPGGAEAFLAIAVGLGHANAMDLAEHFATRHPSERMRLAAWDAQAGVLGHAGACDALWRRAEGSGSRLVAMEAKARRAALVED